MSVPNELIYANINICFVPMFSVGAKDVIDDLDADLAATAAQKITMLVYPFAKN